MPNTTKKGTFRTGESGNKRGRPVGSSPAAAWRDAVGKDVGKVIATVVRLAIGGDAACCRLVLERTVPAYKPMENGVPLPAMPATATLTERALSVMNAMQAGLVTPQSAASLITALAAMVRSTEASEMQRRLEILEADQHREQGHG